MALPSFTETLNNINSSTLPYEMERKVNDLSSIPSGLYKRLYANKKTITGGQSISQPIRYGYKKGKAWGSGSTFPIKDPNILATALYDKCRYENNVVLKRTEWEDNSGDMSKIFDLMGQKYESIIDGNNVYWTTGIYSDGINPDGDPHTYIVGLQAIVASSTATNPTVGAYGGIDRTDAAFAAAWRPNHSSAAVAVGALTTAMINPTYQLCRHSDFLGIQSEPTVMVTTPTIYNQLWVLAEAKAIYSAGKAEGYMAKFGPNGISFNGTEIIEDAYCPAGRIYILNERYLFLKMQEGIDFTWEKEFRYEVDGPDAVKHQFATGQLICNGPCFQGVISDIA